MVAKLIGTDLGEIPFRDLDHLMACVGLTIGTRETVRFLTPRYLKAFLSFPAFGWYTNGEMLRDRLDRYGFDDWSHAQRLATATALELMGRALVLTADEHDRAAEIDGMNLIAWAETKQAAAAKETESRRHKATMRRRRRKPSKR